MQPDLLTSNIKMAHSPKWTTVEWVWQNDQNGLDVCSYATLLRESVDILGTLEI